MKPKSISELVEWMKSIEVGQTSYPFQGEMIHEEMGIQKWGSLYIWYYIERGERKNLDYFQTEEEIVEFAYNHVLAEHVNSTNNETDIE